jgi:hypothetical protein
MFDAIAKYDELPSLIADINMPVFSSIRYRSIDNSAKAAGLDC